MISGRVLYVDGQEVWRAVGRNLLRSNDGGRSWALRAVLPTDGLREQLTFSRLGRRLARSGYHHFVKTGTDSGLVIAHQHVFQLWPGDEGLHRTARLQGSRPLSLCVAEGEIFYGEYRGNPGRGPIHIWVGGPGGDDWQPAWRFDGVRHVHGVFYDPYTSTIWVTTGDEDNESAIWLTRDRFRTLNRVVGGSQQLRAVQLLFAEEWIYFGSDAPDEKNHIYRMNRRTGEIEALAAVSGPVFYGAKVGNSLFFSTAVEPSDVNYDRHAEIWGSADGETWKLVKRFRKDRLPMKYFQYGQVNFPAGPGDGKYLWYSPVGTEQDQQTLSSPIGELW